jgi:hypothetical protein
VASGEEPLEVRAAGIPAGEKAAFEQAWRRQRFLEQVSFSRPVIYRSPMTCYSALIVAGRVTR